MKCGNCGSDLDKRWEFCPACGFRTEKVRSFDDIFSRIKKELFNSRKQFNDFEKNVEAVDISPFFKRPNGGGFSIKIYRSDHEPPRVQVKAFGGVDQESIRKAVYTQLGMKGTGVQELRKRAKEIQKEEKRENISSERLKYTEEPKTSVKRLGDKVAVKIELPGVKSLGEIRINELENSVEVKAVVGDKAFFKILTKPPQFRLTEKTLSNSILNLEFA